MPNSVQTTASRELLSFFTAEDEELLRYVINSAKRCLINKFKIKNSDVELHADELDIRLDLWTLKAEFPELSMKKIGARLLAKIIRDELSIPRTRYSSSDDHDDENDVSLVFQATNGMSVLDQEIEWAERVELEEKIDSAIAEHPLMYQTLCLNKVDISSQMKLTRRRVDQKIKLRMEELKSVMANEVGSQPDFFGGSAA